MSPVPCSLDLLLPLRNSGTTMHQAAMEGNLCDWSGSMGTQLLSSIECWSGFQCYSSLFGGGGRANNCYINLREWLGVLGVSVHHCLVLRCWDVSFA